MRLLVDSDGNIMVIHSSCLRTNVMRIKNGKHPVSSNLVAETYYLTFWTFLVPLNGNLKRVDGRWQLSPLQGTRDR
jgi:hypothetical protein